MSNYFTEGALRDKEEKLVDSLNDAQRGEKSKLISNALNDCVKNGGRIMVATDWHLWKKIKVNGEAVEGKTKKRSNFDEVMDAVHNTIKPNDVLVYLGDLVDGECKEKGILKLVVNGIICKKKILVLGNNDVFDEAYYKNECGFDYVVKSFVYNNILFSHIPQEDNKYCINVHGHIHGYGHYWIPYTNQIDAAAYGAMVTPIELNKLLNHMESYSKNNAMECPEHFGESIIHKLITSDIKYDDSKNWKLRSSKQIFEDGKANCHDISRYFCEEMSHSGLLFMIEYSEGKPVGGRTHSICYTVQHGSYFWCEYSWEEHRGINGPYKSKESMVSTILKSWDFSVGYDKLHVVECNPDSLKTGMDLKQYVDKCMNNSTVIQESWNDFVNGVNAHSKKLFFHVSFDENLDEKILIPRVPTWIKDMKDPETIMKYTGKYEDIETPRVCFSASIEGALNSIIDFREIYRGALNGRQIYVYIPEKPMSEYKHKTNKEIIRDADVFDATTTGEMWILEPVKLKPYGSIVIDQVLDNGKLHNIAGKKGSKKVEDRIGKYSYKWHWFTHPSVMKQMEKYKSDPGPKWLFRITYDGKGIYDVLKKKMTRQEWMVFKRSSAAIWLPTPPEYDPDCLSYFTKKGKDMFMDKTYKLIAEYLDTEKISVDSDLRDNIGEIVYEDEFQVIAKPAVVKESYIQEETLTAAQRKRVTEWGLPANIDSHDEYRHTNHYPLNDKDHVISAMKLFGHCPEKYKEELATNIIDRANDLHIDHSGWRSIHAAINQTKQEGFIMSKDHIFDYFGELDEPVVDEVPAEPDDQSTEAPVDEVQEMAGGAAILNVKNQLMKLLSDSFDFIGGSLIPKFTMKSKEKPGVSFDITANGTNAECLPKFNGIPDYGQKRKGMSLMSAANTIADFVKNIVNNYDTAQPAMEFETEDPGIFDYFSEEAIEEPEDENDPNVVSLDDEEADVLTTAEDDSDKISKDSFGTDESDVQNEYDEKDVEYLNKLIASEASAMSEYLDGAKETSDNYLRKLYSDIGDEERFHLEQLLFAKSQLTGEKYEPRDPEVKKEYDELVDGGMDEETAMATVSDKMRLSIETDDEVDEEELTEEFDLNSSVLSSNNLLLTIMEMDDLSDETMVKSYGIIVEAFTDMSTNSKSFDIKNAITTVVGIVDRIATILTRIKNKIVAMIKTSSRNAAVKAEWLKKHSIVDLFAKGIHLYCYNDKTEEYKIDDLFLYIKKLSSFANSMGYAINNGETNQDITAILKELDMVSMTKTKVVVNKATEEKVKNELFGVSEENKNVYKRIMNVLDYALSVTTDVKKIIKTAEKFEGKQGTIYQTNNELYRDVMKVLYKTAKSLNNITVAIQHDARVMWELDSKLANAIDGKPAEAPKPESIMTEREKKKAAKEAGDE